MILFFYGRDTYSLAAETKNLKKQFAQKHSLSGLEEAALASGTPDGEALAYLRELFSNTGLFSSAKLVIFRNILGEISKLPESQKFLIQKLKDLPTEFSIIVYQDQAFDRRLKFFKTLSTLSESKEFSVPSGKELEKWIENYLAANNFRIDSAALRTFTDLLGENEEESQYDLWQVASELEKQMLYSWNTKTIDASQITSLVQPNITQNIFSLTNLVAAGDIRAAVRLMELMVDTKNAAESKTQILQIVGALAAQIRNLIAVKELESKSPGAIAKTLSWKEGRVWINLKLAKKYTGERLRALLSDLKALDLRLKTSEEPPKLLLTLFFQKAKA